MWAGYLHQLAAAQEVLQERLRDTERRNEKDMAELELCSLGFRWFSL